MNQELIERVIDIIFSCVENPKITERDTVEAILAELSRLDETAQEIVKRVKEEVCAGLLGDKNRSHRLWIRTACDLLAAELALHYQTRPQIDSSARSNGDKPTRAYRVEVREKSYGRAWYIIDLDDVAFSTSLYDEDVAEYWCEQLNKAFQNGWNRRVVLTPEMEAKIEALKAGYSDDDYSHSEVSTAIDQAVAIVTGRQE